MRVLICHNWYQQTGGEDNVVRTEMSLLTRKGHAVALLDADNRSISSLGDKVRTAASVAHSRETGRAVQSEIARTRPDVVHVHNFFPLLTPAVLEAASQTGVAVVHTLHNYRLLCPAATMSRLGRPCELCITGDVTHAIRHRCYRGSYPGSAAVAGMVAFHRKAQTFSRRVDRFVALTDFAKSVFVRGGFPAEKIDVKPDATPDPADLMPRLRTEDVLPRGGGALFLGRLSHEKGVSTLLRAWRGVPVPLRIAGTGPFNGLVAQAALDSTRQIEYLGFLPSDEIHARLLEADFVVMPSQCYEGFGIVIIEAFAHGVPVIASRLGSMAEIVEEGVTGMLFEPGDPRDLAAKARWLAVHPEERRRMGREARRAYEAHYTLDINYSQLMQVYERAMASASQRSVA